MTQTTATKVRQLCDAFADEFTDTEIDEMIEIAYIRLSNITANAFTGDEEEILHRYLSSHTLITRKGLKYTGKGVSNMTVSRISLNRSSPEDLMKSKQLWTEFTELLKSMTSKTGLNYTKMKTTSGIARETTGSMYSGTLYRFY